MIQLGDLTVGATIDFTWSTNAGDGASITRATNGTISVYKGNSTTQSTAGVTDTEDFDSLTGVHHCRITTASDATFYSAGNDFNVVLSGATIDGKVVNAPLAHFSIQNRYQDKVDFGLSAAAVDAILDDVVEGSLTARQALRLMLASLTGKASGGGTTTVSFRDVGDTKNRLVMTTDANGNRTAVTRDAT